MTEGCSPVTCSSPSRVGTGRVEWSSVSALSSIVPNGHQVLPTVPPPPLVTSYGLMRQSDELRPTWASSAYSGQSLPSRAVRLTFPSLAVVYGRACPSRGLPQPESAITTRPNHELPRQDLHLPSMSKVEGCT